MWDSAMHSDKNQILINAAQTGEIRVALLEGGKLFDLDIEYSGYKQEKLSIYAGIITRIEPSLEAAFIDYGAARHGFLPFREMDSACFRTTHGNDTQAGKNALKVGQKVMIQ